MLGTDPDAAEMSADPVNLSTGNFVYDHQDLIVGGEIPLVFIVIIIQRIQGLELLVNVFA